MRILVTGGAGFIGKHIVDLLINKGYDVVVIDNLCKGNIINVNKKAKFYKLDISSEEIDKLFEKEGLDIVIHLAAKVNVRKSLEDPISYTNSNLIGTLKILECCRKHNVKRIIFSASASRYGNPRYLPCDEKHPINPLSPYALSKYAAENYIQLYSKLYDIKYTILVYSNVYGPGQELSEESGVITLFINKLLSGEKPTIYGNGLQTRDFVYVEDVAFANFLAIINRNSENRTFNVSSEEEISINNLFEKIKRMLNKEITPTYKPKSRGEIEKIYLSNKLIEKELNFWPKTKIGEGLKKTIEYYKTYKSL